MCSLDDMLDSNQSLMDQFSLKEHTFCVMFIIYHKVTSIYLNAPYVTYQISLILFQRTWKDVAHIYENIAGFDVSYGEWKS